MAIDLIRPNEEEKTARPEDFSFYNLPIRLVEESSDEDQSDCI
jgi:hypothetical protein